MRTKANNFQKQQGEVMTTCQKCTAQGDQKVNELAKFGAVKDVSDLAVLRLP